MKREVSILITDLDNTLYDWVDIWYKSFSAMLEKLVDLSGISRETLISEFKAIHQRHATSEYAFSIEELPSLIAKHPGEDLSNLYIDAIMACRNARKKATRLYPGVQETLEAFKHGGALVIAYTESMAFYSRMRIKRLGLDGIIDVLYSPPDHELPNGVTPDKVRSQPGSYYEFEKTAERHTPQGKLKPSPEVLLEMVSRLGGKPDEAVYVGDDLLKDVSMAKSAGVLDVWAKFGQAHDTTEYELLKKVTHWTEDAVRRQREATPERIEPSVTLDESFAEILSHVTPVPCNKAQTVSHEARIGEL